MAASNDKVEGSALYTSDGVPGFSLALSDGNKLGRGFNCTGHVLQASLQVSTVRKSDTGSVLWKGSDQGYLAPSFGQALRDQPDFSGALEVNDE